MDDRDELLLALLRGNARLPVSELSRRLNLSRTATQARLSRLEKTGVIAGYTVRLSPDREANEVRALVMIKSPPGRRSHTERELARVASVMALHSISGEFDLVAEIQTRNVGDLDQVIDRIGALTGVADTLSSVILSTKFRR